MDWKPIITPVLTAVALGIATWITRAFARVQKKVEEKVEAETVKIKNDTLRGLAEQAVQAAEQMAKAALKAGVGKWTSGAKLENASIWLAKRAELDVIVARGLIEAAVHNLEISLNQPDKNLTEGGAK